METPQFTQESKTEQAPPKRRLLNWRGLVQAFIGIGALALVIVRSDTHSLVEAFKATKVSYLPVAILTTIFMTWLMAYRWGVILRIRGDEISTSRLFAYYLIAIFFGNFVPGGTVTADVARLVYASRDVKDKPFVLSTLVYERMTGMFVLLFIGLGATFASRVYRPDGALFYFAEALLTLAFIFSAMLMSDFTSKRLARLCLWAGELLRIPKIGEAASKTLEAISSLRQYKMMFLTTVLISVVARVVWSLGCYVIAVAMDLPLSLAMVFAVMSLVDLIRMLPISVGGLGVREWTMIALFANVGIAREQALLFSLLAFAPVVLTAIAGGIIYVSRSGIMRVERNHTGDAAVSSANSR
jgi:uncharacterized protein (TIRG00374 family)